MNRYAKDRNPPWWNRRTRMERTLCGVTTVSMVMFLAMAVALAVLGYHYQENLGRSGVPFPSNADRLIGSAGVGEDSAKLCLSPGCVNAASTLLQNMNQSVDPCENFYEFACGGWVHRHLIPEDKSSLSQFSLIQDQLDAKLRTLVEEPPQDSEPGFIHKMKHMYRSCFNTSLIDSYAEEPLQKVLKVLGGWPVVEGPGWNASKFHWLDALIQYRNFGYSHDILLDLSVIPDFRNNTRYIIDLDQTSLGLPDRTYLLKGLNDSAVAAYLKLMTEAAQLLGADKKSAEAELREALQFETTLANYSLPREERRNISRLYNKMPLYELKKLAPQIDWDRYFNSLLVDKVASDEPINVVVPEFVQQFESLILRTPARTVANYMVWRVVLQSYATLGKPWRERLQEFNAVLTGKTRETARWEQCMGSLTGSLGIALSSLYVRHFFQEDSKGAALDMVNFILKEFVAILDDIDWMDEQTRQRARQKAQAIQPYIGYPEELLRDALVEEHYRNVTLRPDAYFENIMRLRKWSTDYAFGQLRKPHIKGEWKKHAQVAVVNAYYNSLENCIEFPAGILQGAFFSKDRPSYMNYGAIGFVIGHEITHGFDDRGRQFDKDGNNINWWEHETDLKFRQRAQCIVEQYGNYTVSEGTMKVNGVNTQGENIADNGGIKEAFNAYKKWVKENGPEAGLPGLKYTPSQLFWISAANVWCGKYRPEVMKLRILSGSHSPAPFRVIGPMSNTPEFAAEFNCPVGSPMNPVNKCTVW
ncbi:neprilysin-2 isoform X2 [Ixodes scapularis]|uniref:neprilysin-2 isoform X2 n=1 Tax=Ixodes scapularis TaxID=6945 RepID=UPI0011619E70|nr:neprilysin-2 isoform X2 [Ixodes scapularis]